MLADPSTHLAIDGTGWVRESLDGNRLTETGQIFRMAMYYDNEDYPDEALRSGESGGGIGAPAFHCVAAEAGGDDDANLEFGGSFWRYDLEQAGAGQTMVTLSYDWSAGAAAHSAGGSPFPPFDPQHLDNSLKHLAELAER